MIKYLLLFLLGLASNVLFAQDSVSVETKNQMWYGIAGTFGGSCVNQSPSLAAKADLRMLKEETYKMKLGVQFNYFNQNRRNLEYGTYFSTVISGGYWTYFRKCKLWGGGDLGYVMSDQAEVFSSETYRLALGLSWKFIELRGEVFASFKIGKYQPGLSLLFGIP